MSHRQSVRGIVRQVVSLLSGNEQIATDSDTIQRERLVFANLLSLAVITLVTLTNIIFPSKTNYFPIVDLLVCASLVWVIVAALKTTNVQMFCHIWMAIAAGALWIDSLFTGGVTGHNAPLLVLLPVGAGLLLGPGDIIRVGVANALAIFMIGAFACIHAPFHLHDNIMTNGGLLIATSTAVTATVCTLVVHYQRVDRKRMKLLAAKEHVANHDGLTGLLNRATTAERLSQLKASTDRVNLFLLDLDGFKDINDTYGHDVGDKLLIAVAERLRATAPLGSKVSRLGGDEFLILAEADADGRSMNWTSDKCPGEALVEALCEPFPIGELHLQMSGSIGVAHFPADAHDGDQLLKRADLALYAAKDMGRNKCMAFNPAMEAEQNRRIELQTHLRAALERGDIFLHYQPQFCLQTGNLTGFEALSRWKDDVLGLVGPDKFVPIAEDCGLIGELGEQVLRRACREALEWPCIQGQPPFKLSVNVSTLQLTRANIVGRIETILEETGFPVERLELEITESVLISEPEKAMVILNQLAAMGIAIAMDDFGKGYSSLSYLQSFSLTRLKIDRSFIANLSHKNGVPIVQAIVDLAKAMDLTVVAEGVETESQRQMLRDIGCHFAQGFLYAPGLSIEDTLKEIIAAAAKQAHRTSPSKREDSQEGLTVNMRSAG